MDEIEPRPTLAESPNTEEREPPAAALRYLETGRRQFEERLWTGAITALEKALKLEPRLVEARILLARAAIRQGNNDWAESHLQEAIKQRPNDVAVNQLLGEIAWRANHAGEAIRYFRLALMSDNSAEDRPETVLAHLSLAMALRKEGYLSASIGQLNAYLEAVREPTAAMKAHEELNEVMVLYRGTAAGLLGEIHTQLGQYEEAVAAYRRAAEETPEDSGVQGRLAKALARSGHPAEALDVVHRLLADSRSQADGLRLLRDICTMLGDADRYDAEIARLATDATNPALQRQLAGVLQDRGKTDAAIGVLEKLTSQDSVQSEVLIQLAELYLKRRRLDGFLMTVGRVASKDAGTKGRADTLLKEAASDAGLRKGLSDAAEQVSRQHPEDVAAAYVHGRILALDGHTGAAVKEYEKAVKLAPKSAAAAAALSGALVDGKRWEEAIAAASAAIERDVRTAEIYLAKGRAHDALDEREEAESAYMEALRLDRKSVECRLLMAGLAERSGDTRRFEMLHRQIIEDVDPRCAASREALVRLYLTNDRVDQAKGVFAGFERLGIEGPEAERCKVLMDFINEKASPGKARLDDYRDALRRIIEKYPEEVATRIDLARTYEASGEYEACLQITEEAVRLSPDSIDARILKAKTLANLLRFEDAEEVIRELLKERPRNALWQRQLVELARNRGDFEGALPGLRALISREDLGPAVSLLKEELIQVLVEAKHLEEAVEVARRWQEEAPREDYRRVLYLRVLSAADRNDEAVDVARRWLEKDPTSASLRRHLLQRLIVAERFVEAQQMILAWLVEDPDNDTLNVLLLQLLWSTKEWESALDIAGCAAEEEEKHDVYIGLVGETLLRAGQYDKAIDHCQSAINAFQESKKPTLEARRADRQKLESLYRNLIRAYLVAERYDEAERVIRTLPAEVVLESSLPRGRGGGMDPYVSFMITICQRTGRLDQAIRYLEEMHEAEPDDPGTCNDLGYTWVDAGQHLERAEKLIRYAVAAMPRNSAFLDSLGWVNYKRGRMDEAIKYLELALRHLGGDDPVMCDHLGDAYYRSNQSDKAKANWEKSLARLAEIEKDGSTLDIEQRKLRESVTMKLKQLDGGESVDTAPIGEQPVATSRPAA